MTSDVDCLFMCLLAMSVFSEISSLVKSLLKSFVHFIVGVFVVLLISFRASLVAQKVKNPPTMQETWVWSLSWEDPQDKGMATHSSVLTWRIPWTEELGGLQSMRSQGSDMTEHLSTQHRQYKYTIYLLICH